MYKRSILPGSFEFSLFLHTARKFSLICVVLHVLTWRKTMYVVSDRLIVGQITFIFRVVIQILSYGGIFLLGIILLSHTPQVAPLETHDALNRMVGKSTATLSSLRWVKNRILSRGTHPSSSSSLFVALVLSLSYGLCVALTDIGFIGLHSCSVPYPSFTDFPGSVRSEADAFALVNRTVIPGVDPNKVRSFRCSSSEPISSNNTETLYSCTSWTNSTFGDPSSFRSVNLTDTDALMFRYMSPDNLTVLEQQVYYFGSLGSIEMSPKVKSGIAVLPHSTGATMIIGTPNLDKNQTVGIPKTMALDVSFGCLPLGVEGVDDAACIGTNDHLVPEDLYKSTRQSDYTGPQVLYQPLVTAADSIRQLIIPSYDTSTTDWSGYYKRRNTTSVVYTWTREVASWFPDYGTQNDSARALYSILDPCSKDVYQALNLQPNNERYSRACATLTLTGSFINNSTLIRGYSSFVCASTTSLRMVSTTLTADQQGLISSKTVDHPTELHDTKANFWDIYHNGTSEVVTLVPNDGIQRYTLSENPSGSNTHYILQKPLTGSGSSMSEGAGSVGHSFPQLAMASLDPSSPGTTPTETVINSTFFSGNNFSSGFVTEWAGSHAAAYMLSSYALNGWVAVGKDPLTVRSISGRPAVCYKGLYFIAFVPLLLAGIVIVVWTMYLIAASKLGAAIDWEKRYGGLGPTVVGPPLIKKSLDDIYSWEDVGNSPHLRLVQSDTESTFSKDLKELVCDDHTDV